MAPTHVGDARLRVMSLIGDLQLLACTVTVEGCQGSCHCDSGLFLRVLVEQCYHLRAGLDNYVGVKAH